MAVKRKPKPHSKPVTWAIDLLHDRSFQIIAAVVIGLPTFFVGVAAIDGRWLHSEVYAADQRQQGVQYQNILGQLEINRLSAEVIALEQQRALVARDMRVLVTDRRTTPATLQLYQADYQDLTRKINAKVQLVDRLRAGK